MPDFVTFGKAMLYDAFRGPLRLLGRLPAPWQGYALFHDRRH